MATLSDAGLTKSTRVVAVFSEYHGMGSKTAAYMIRKGRYKLVTYADYAPQLFDLGSDPEELDDLAGRTGAKGIVDALTAELYRVCDPHVRHRRAQAREPVAVERSEWAQRRLALSAHRVPILSGAGRNLT